MKLSHWSNFSPRRFFPVLATFLALAVTFAIYIRSERIIDRLNDRRHESFMLVDELRHSSDDLTRMVRTYVVTGDPTYKTRYLEILAIRDGKIPRPEDYQYVFWDLQKNADKLPVSGETGVTLLDLMDKAGFTADELSKLAEAKHNSDVLTVVELEAMNLLENAGSNAAADKDRAIRMLHDEAYHSAKAAVMEPINQSYMMMDRRTTAAVNKATRNAILFLIAFVICIIGSIAVILQTGASMLLTLGGTAAEVRAHILRIGQGNLSSTITLAPGTEDSILAHLGKMQHMLREIESERDRNEHFGETGREILQILNENTGAHESIGRILATLKTRTGMDAVAIRLNESDGSAGFEEETPLPDYVQSDDLTVETVPIRMKDRIVGELRLKDRRADIFTRGTIEQFESIAAHIGEALTRKQAESALRSGEQMLHTVIEHFPGDVFWKDTNSVFLGCNQSFADDVGLRNPADIIGMSDVDLPLGSSDAINYRAADKQVMDSGKPKLHIIFHQKKDDGSETWLDTSKIPLRDPEGKIIGILGVSADITERKLAERQIQDLVLQLDTEKRYAQKNALTDGLTRLANRRNFDDSLNREFFRLRRSGAPLSLIMLDIDHFKKFNDHYGHQAGDDCLRAVAGALQTVAGRAPDIVARYGGEEFVAILPETDLSGAKTLAERLRKSVADLAIPHAASETAAYVTVSLGVTTVEPIRLSAPDKIVAQADQAMYRAKQNGRNRVETAVTDEHDNRGSTTSLEYLQLFWHNGDESGNPVIDSQHKNLFEVSNMLLTSLTNNQSKETCSVLLRNLLNDIAAHFRDEEVILASVGYPFAETHHMIHEELKEKASGLADAYKLDQMSLEDLFNFIVYEIVDQHMLMEDKKYFPYI